MAHVAKVKMAGVANVVGHYERLAESRGYERENIDGSRTHLNYAVGSGDLRPESLALVVRERVSEARQSHEKASGKALRKDANVLMDWVVTRPQDCPEGLTEAFFEAVVAFVQERYGRENVPGGFVHMDETTPHVHIPVIPVRDGKLVASKVVNRADLRTFHSDLGRAVDRALGVHVSIELDDEAHLSRALYHADSQRQFKAARDAATASIASEVDAARDELARIERETVAAQERLESLQRACQEAEPAAESFAESARYIREHRGDGERAEQLAGEVAQLRAEVERVDGDAAACRAAAERAEAEGAASRERAAGLAGLRDRVERSCADLERRVGLLADEFRRVVGGVVWNVSEGVRDVLAAFGVDARTESPGLDWMLGEARRAADAYNQRRGWDEPSRGGWGLSR